MSLKWVRVMSHDGWDAPVLEEYMILLSKLMQFCCNEVTHITVFFTESGEYTDYSDDDYLETRRRRSRRNQKRQVNYKEDSESDGSQKSVRYGKELRRVHKRRLSTSDSEGKINSKELIYISISMKTVYNSEIFGEPSF